MTTVLQGGDVDEPMYCHQVAGCDSHYSINGLSYLNLTCIDCDNIPQMADISVMWQVRMTYDLAAFLLYVRC